MLQFRQPISESEARAAIIECGRLCYERRLMTSNDGNISVRISGGICITPAGFSKGRLSGDDLLVVDLDGRVISSRPGRNPSTETPMHLEVYQQRQDANAVIHAHPVFATALTVAGLGFPSDVLPEVLLTLGAVPVAAYATPSSRENAEAVRPFVKNHNAILLRQHGSLTFGKDLEEALIHLERIEHVAEVFWRAQMLGKVNRLPPETIERLTAVREKFSKR